MSNQNPLVCICIPTFNAERTIEDTIQSLLSQTYSNIIIKVVDNASNDNTLDIVRQFSDPRISIFQGKSNIGGEGNFNRCIELATGDYMAIFHADDVYEPTMVAFQVAKFVAEPTVGAVFTEARLINMAGRSRGVISRPRELRSSSNVYEFSDIFRAILLHSNFLICPSAMIRTKIYREEIGRFRADLFGSSADLDVWLRVLERHSIAILPDQLIRYRISTNQGSHTLGRMRTTRADLLRVLDHYVEKENVKSLLGPTDIRNKSWLERTDRIVRASNLFLIDRDGEAAELCTGSLSFDALHAALMTRRGLMTLLLAAYLRIWQLLPFNSLGKVLLRRIKTGTFR